MREQLDWRSHVDFWKREIHRNPAVLLVLAVCAMVWTMNFRAGYEIGNRDLLVGAMFVVGGVFAAYCAVMCERLRDWTWWVFFAVALAGFQLDQFSGYQALEMKFAEGATSRQTQAMGLAGVRRQIEADRAELEKIGVTRAVAEVKADERLECARKSSAYPDGIGPNCTRLRSELGRIDRKAALEHEIPDLQKQLEGRKQIGDAGVNLAIPLMLANRAWRAIGGDPADGIKPRHVLLGLELAMILVFGFIATFGFWMCGVRLGGAADDRIAGLLASPEAGESEVLREARDARIGAQMGDGGRGPSGSGGGGGGGVSLPAGMARTAGMSGGAEVHVHVAAAAPAAAPAAAAAAPAGVSISGPAAVDAVLFPRRDLTGLDAGVRPIDRSTVTRALTADEREAADTVLAFVRAVVEQVPSAHVSMVDLYKRYCRWCGERAVSASSFGALLPELTGVMVVDVAGQLHAKGVALRAGTQLSAVGRAVA